MTALQRETVTCSVCGAESAHDVAVGVASEGPPDLDTRPSGALRATMPHWVQRCPACGYCAPELAAAPPRAERVVTTAAYRAVLDDPARPALANRFLCASAVLEHGAAFADAGWQAAYAAWACDDEGRAGAARECRARAIELFEKAEEVGQPVAEEPGAADAVVADLLRRAGRFDDAVARAEAGRARATDDLVRHALRYTIALARGEDAAVHSIAEAAPALDRDARVAGAVADVLARRTRLLTRLAEGVGAEEPS